MLQVDMPSTDPTLAYDPCDAIYTSEASYYGKKFLRMTGIAQMLHALQPPSDKYLYAHGERKRLTQPRTQIRQ